MLDWGLFEEAVEYGRHLGYRVTASVFDKESVEFLLGFDPPFVKIANRPYLRHLAKYVPRGIPIVYSRDGALNDIFEVPEGRFMVCVPRYPATIEDYEGLFGLKNATYLKEGISDHTIGLDLWRKHKPHIYEKHFRLESSTGPDAGPWAATPNELKEVFTDAG